MSINFEFSDDSWRWESEQIIEENKAYVLKQIKTMTWADIELIRSAEWRNETFVVQAPNSFDAWMFHITAVDYEKNWAYLYWGGIASWFNDVGITCVSKDDYIQNIPWYGPKWFMDNGLYKQPVRVKGVKGLW